MDNNVPFATVEIMATRQDRTVKRLVIAFLIAICVICISNAVMFCCWCHYEHCSDSNAEAVTESYADCRPRILLCRRHHQC